MIGIKYDECGRPFCPISGKRIPPEVIKLRSLFSEYVALIAFEAETVKATHSSTEVKQ